MGQAVPKFQTPKLQPAKFRGAEAQPVIVQCPACQTKFAIEAKLLVEVETPRFHCSRCDHVFTCEDAAVKSAPSQTPRKEEEDGQQPQEAIEPHHPDDREFADLVDEMAALQDSVAAHASTEAVRSPAVDPLEGASAPHSVAPAHSLSFPRSSNLAQRVSAPHEHEPAPPFRPQVEMFSGPAAVTAPVMDKKNRSGTGSSKDDFSKYAVSFAEPDEQFANTPTQEFAREPRSSLVSKLISGPSLASIRRPDVEHSGTRGLLVVGLALLGFLLVLGIFTLVLTSDPGKATGIASHLITEQAQIPPSTLYIRDTKLEQVGLDNGETVHLLTGTIVNDGSQEFAQIKIEGALFDRSGKLLRKLLIPAESSLAKTRIRSLSIESLEAMQAGQLSRKFELPAGGNSPFALAFPVLPDESPMFYTARIYSVR